MNNSNKAFSEFEFIDSAETIQDKHKLWLIPYENLIYSIALQGKHKIKWATEKRKYENEQFNPEINQIQRHPRRTIIEFDGNEKKAKEYLEQTYNKLKKMKIGFIRSTHKGKTDYLHVEFIRDMEDEEIKQFLFWIAPNGSEIDLNFASSKKVFQVLYAVHWKHSFNRELPVEYFEGDKIDFDGLNISQQRIQKKVTNKQSYNYETALKRDYSSLSIQQLLKEGVKKEKPIIEKFLPEGSVISIFGEPASLKSILACYISCCVSTGRRFLSKFKTRKLPTLVLSTENPKKLDAKRFKALFKGMGIIPLRRKPENLMLSVCNRDKISILNDNNYYEALKKLIEEKKIKFLVIDTLSPMISDMDNNSANAIVEVFNERLFPLTDKFGLTILLVLHSQKSGRDFLGSVKFKASVDLFYEALRDEKNPNRLSLLCHKGREGEPNLKLNVDFEKKSNELKKINFGFEEFFMGKQSVNLKDVNPAKVDTCKELIIELLQDKKLQYNEIIKELENKGQTKSTIKRAMNFLYEDNKIGKEKGKQGGYYVK